MEPPRDQRPGMNRGCAIAIGLVVALLVVTVFCWNSAQELPVINVPTPKHPNPNAFDTFNGAAGQLLDGSKIGYAISTIHTGAKDDREYSWTEKEKLVSENGPALTLIRQGLNEEYLNPPARSFNALFPYYAQFRSLARTLALDSQVKAHRGDNSGAAQASMDAMEMGTQIPHGSVMIGGLVGIACQSIGRRQIWPYLDRLSLDQTRAAARRIERIRNKRVPYSALLQEEKWAVQSGLLEVLRKPNSLSVLAQSVGAPAPAVTTTPFLSQFVFLVYNKRRIMSGYTNYIDAEIARSKHPYGTTVPVPVPSDPINQILVPVYDQTAFRFAKNDAQNGLLEAAVALRAYRLVHGAYPTSLDALGSDLPHERTIDPFANGAPFRYRKTSGGYVLYSVGPDGKDDGGKAIDTGSSRASSPNERYFVLNSSAGDIVAGKNIW